MLTQSRQGHPMPVLSFCCSPFFPCSTRSDPLQVVLMEGLPVHGRGTCAGLRAKIRTDLPQNAGTTLVFAKTNPIEWDSGRPNRYGGRVPAVSTAPTCPTAAAKTRPTPSTPPTHAIFSVLTALKRCPNSTEEMS